MNKPRGDSKLKTLPQDTQKVLFGWLCAGTYESAMERAASDFGIQTSVASLSDFYSWYSLGRKLERADEFAEALAKRLESIQHLKLDGDQLSLAAQAIFEMRVEEQDDVENHVALRKLRQNDKRLKQNDLKIAQQERKIALLERQAELANQAKAVTNSAMTPEEKAARIQEIFGTT